jgi:hypothetical protein
VVNRRRRCRSCPLFPLDDSSSKITEPLNASIVLAAALFIPPLIVEAGDAETTRSATQSLKGKTDEELLHLVTGGRNDTQKKTIDGIRGDLVSSSPLDRLWEMPSRQAALALASEYVEKEAKGRVKFTIEGNANTKPPTSGEIGIRWVSGNYYVLPERGMTILHYDRLHSRLSISAVQILGPVPRRELEESLSRTDDYDVPVPVAQQGYEILWWLNRIRPVSDRVGGSGGASTDDASDAFWMNPNGPYFGRGLLGSPNAEDLGNEEFSSLPAFAYAVIGRVIERQGIKLRRPLPTIGRYVEANADATFLRLHPAPESDEKSIVRHWIEQMIGILRKPDRFKMYNDVLCALVPTSEPLRYKDPAIDRALLDLLREADPAAALHDQAAKAVKAQQQKIWDDTAQGNTNIDSARQRELSNQYVGEKSAALCIRMAAETAGEMLGFRDQASVFSALMERAKRPKHEDDGFIDSYSLTGAAALAGKYPKLRPPLISYLRTQLVDIRKSQVNAQQFFDCIWRADVRDLTPDLEKVATSSPEENEDGAMYTRPAPPEGNGKFHAARAILIAWRETDPLTKIKLDALINGYISRGGPISDLLRTEFGTLSADEQLAFRNFITWMRTVDVSLSLECLEDVFTPHTPRPREERNLRQFWYE